jgi:hypothetical protein
VQVDPEAQVVLPEYPIPPHCPYFGTGAPVPEAAVELVELVAFVTDEVPVVEAWLDVLAAPVPLVQVATTAGPVGVSEIESSALTQPVLAVNAAGHVICL